MIVCGKSGSRLQNKTILRACEIRSHNQCVSFAPPISLKLSLSHYRVSHGLESFSVTGVLTSPNG